MVRSSISMDIRAAGVKTKARMSSRIEPSRLVAISCASPSKAAPIPIDATSKKRPPRERPTSIVLTIPVAMTCAAASTSRGIPSGPDEA